MEYCPYCGKALEEPCSFCPYCGKQLPIGGSAPKTAAPRKLNFKALLVIPVIAALVLVLALTRTAKPFSEDTDAIAEASRSVVTIYTYDVNDINLGTGSGFAAIDEGIIVTNHHVIAGDTYRIEAHTEDGAVLEADSIIAYDAEKDIAILRFTDCTLTPLSTDGGMNLERGEPLTAIGSPEGLSNMVSDGVFSSYKSNGTHTLQVFTTSISHGSSGGAIFDDKGNAVGITSAGHAEGNEIYFAVPFVYVTELYDNRSPADEITPAKLWEQSDHTYTVDYVLSFPRKLNGKNIELEGYVAALYYDLYLVADPSLVLSTYSSQELTEDGEKLLWDLIREQMKQGNTLQCQMEKRTRFPDELAGKHVTLRGKVTVFPENISGDDVRFIVSEVIASE